MCNLLGQEGPSAIVLSKDLNLPQAKMALAAAKDRGPAPAYQASSPDSPLIVDGALYNAIHTSEKRSISSHTLPIRSGYAWEMKAGQVCRIVTPEGPQVGDLNLWSQNDKRERFWASRTRQLQASHVRRLDRLWSCLPWIRPMVTVTGDSLGERFGDEYGMDQDGGRVHDLLGTRCDPYSMALDRGCGFGPNALLVNQVLSGEGFDYHCHSNLTRAIRPLGLDEMDVHDVLNVFQVTGLNKDGKYYM
jgi:uncharacterized protein